MKNGSIFIGYLGLRPFSDSLLFFNLNPASNPKTLVAFKLAGSRFKVVSRPGFAWTYEVAQLRA
ncbi:MAG TPA: hypothetical protein DDW65_21835 [Firmicutes bacterium]|nr:hypothetical protein [Bacillota bacterium]